LIGKIHDDGSQFWQDLHDASFPQAAKALEAIVGDGLAIVVLTKVPKLTGTVLGR
jgi:hypothetical protein